MDKTWALSRPLYKGKQESKVGDSNELPMAESYIWYSYEKQAERILWKSQRLQQRST